MKISKFTEKFEDVDDFQELIVQKFFEPLGNMGSYDAKIIKNDLNMGFNFQVVDVEEMEQIIELNKFLNDIAKPYHYYLNAFQTPDVEMVKLNILIEEKDIEKVYAELKMFSDAKKYNL